MGVFVVETVEHAERDAAGRLQWAWAPAVDEDRGVVAAVGVGEVPGMLVQHAVEDGHEQLFGVVLLQQIVDAREHPARSAHVLRGGPHQGTGHDHEQGGGHALAGDVGDDDPDPVPVDTEEIVEVAADLLRRLHDAVHLQDPGRRHGGRQEGELYAGRDVQLLLQRDEGVLGGQRFAQAVVLVLYPIGHLLERQRGHGEAVRFPVEGGRGAVGGVGDRYDLALAARRVANQALQLFQLLQHRFALFFVEGVGELRHLPPDEALLPAPLALARTAETIEGDQIGPEHVHRAGDPADLVAGAGTRALDLGLEIAAREGVQHPHPLGQRREGARHVIAETDQHEDQEGDRPAGGEVADQLLPGRKHRHVLDADQACDQAAEVGGLREHHGGVHAVAGFDGLLRIDVVEVDGVLDVLPHGALRACEQAPAAVDDQDRGSGRLLHLQERLADVRGIDAHAADAGRAGGGGQRDAQEGGDVPLLVVADAADAGVLRDGVPRRRHRDDRALEHGGVRRVGERSVGVEHVEAVGDALFAKLPGDVRADPPDRLVVAGVDGLAECLVFGHDPGLVLHVLDQAVDGLAPQGGSVGEHGAGVLRPDQLLALERSERETDAYDGEGQDDEQADPCAQQQGLGSSCPSPSRRSRSS